MQTAVLNLKNIIYFRYITVNNPRAQQSVVFYLYYIKNQKE